MAADSFLAALMDNYGNSTQTTDNVTTVRGLLNFCKKWMDGTVSAEELNNPCVEMAMRLREGAAQMEGSLRQNPDMAAETGSPILRTSQAYLAIADVLEELPELARDGKTEEYHEDLELFEEERLAVLEAQEQIEVQLSGKTALCPCCGSQGEELSCPSCHLLRLYPDPKALKVDEEAARLAGCYGDVYAAFRQVISGESPFENLLSALSALETHLEGLLVARSQLLQQLSQESTSQAPSESELMEALLASTEVNIEMGLSGVARMKNAEQTRRVTDLSRGWDDIYHASQAIEVAASRLLGVLAENDDSVEVGQSSPSSPDDTVSFSYD